MKLIATENIRKGDVLDTVRVDGVEAGEIVVQVRPVRGESGAEMVWPVGVATANTLWGDMVPYASKGTLAGLISGKPSDLGPYFKAGPAGA